MKRTHKESRFEFVRMELINERIADLRGIGDITIQVEPPKGNSQMVLIEVLEESYFDQMKKEEKEK